MRRFLFALFAVAATTAAACGGTETTATSGTTGSGGGTSSSTVTGAGGSSTSTSTSTSTGAGGSPEAGPIDAPDGQWTWVPFADSACGNGSPTGLGINKSSKSKRVALFLMGGGACWDELTCFTIKTASNLSGYGESNFSGDSKGLLNTGIFDRADPNNPFKDYSFVFVPYCTGDVHGGDIVQTYGAQMVAHKGWANMRAFMKRVVPTFPDADRVLLTGSSAGGFGAGLNWWKVQEEMGKIRVDLVDDSGPPFSSMYVSKTLTDTWRKSWNLNQALPPDCPACLDSLDTIFDYYGKKFPTQRAALLSYVNDNVISTFYGLNGMQFAVGLDDLAKSHIDPNPSFHYFFHTGSKHTFLADLSTATNGVTLETWLTQMVTDDAAWASQHP